MKDEQALVAYRSGEIRAATSTALTGPSDDSLMIRAAARLATVSVRVLRERRGGVAGRRVALLVGEGRNGGDALLAGARLAGRGAMIHALLTGNGAYGPGLDALQAARGRVVECRTADGYAAARRVLSAADLVMDGIVGIGGSGGLRTPAAELVRGIPAGVPVVAVDVPSGVDPDTGEITGAYVRADLTVAISAYTPSLLVPPGAHAAGRVLLVDVGLVLGPADAPQVRRLTPAGVAARWPRPQREDHKYTRGVLGVVAGSDMYPGAAVLACAGAIRAGVGIVRYVGPRRVTDQVLIARPEVVAGIGRVQAWLLGSGVEDDIEQEAATGEALDSGLPCVVDAGALEACVSRRAAGVRTASADEVLLTPHAGEVVRMLTMLGHKVERPDIEARPMHHAQWLAREADATVLLKGSVTLVVNPDGDLFAQETGPPWLATAGAGDVLAGIAGALMAAGIGAMEAGAMAAVVHGRAAAWASGGGPIGAADIADATPLTIAELLRNTL